MGGQLSSLLYVAIVIAVFWFLIMRPQQQRQKQQRAMLDALKVGDEIVTAGGIYGIVVDLDERVRIRVYDGTELELARQAVGQVLPTAATEAGASDEVAETETEDGKTTDA